MTIKVLKECLWLTNFNLQLFAEQKEFTLSDFKDGKLEVKDLKDGEKLSSRMTIVRKLLIPS